MPLRSLPRKINFSIIVTAILLNICIGAVLLPLELKRYDSLLEQIHFFLDTVFRQNLDEVANELFAGQSNALRTTISEIMKIDPITGVVIYDEFGKLYLKSHDGLPYTLPQDALVKLQQGPAFGKTHHNKQPQAIYSNVIKRHRGKNRLHYNLLGLKKNRTG